MSMSRKHYVADADALNRILWMPDSDPLTMTRVIAALADVRENDNPDKYGRFGEMTHKGFDRQRFIAACTKDRDTVSQTEGAPAPLVATMSGGDARIEQEKS